MARRAATNGTTEGRGTAAATVARGGRKALVKALGLTQQVAAAG